MDFKYKVGDKVRILDGSNIANYTGGFLLEMKKQVGRVATVKEAFQFNGVRPAYRLSEICFTWDERGLFPADASPLVCNTEIFAPLRIVKNGVATIVFWQDGTKTVVKRGSDEAESDYAAFTAALGIKVFGSNSALKRIVSRTETQEKKRKKETLMYRCLCPYCHAEFNKGNSEIRIFPKDNSLRTNCPSCKSHLVLSLPDVEVEHDADR